MRLSIFVGDLCHRFDELVKTHIGVEVFERLKLFIERLIHDFVEPTRRQSFNGISNGPNDVIAILLQPPHIGCA